MVTQFVFVAGALAWIVPSAGSAAFTRELLRPVRALAIEPTGRSGRSAVFTDPVLAALASGARVQPAAGDRVAGPNGAPRVWREARWAANGALESDLRSLGWIWAEFESDRDAVLLLDAPGCAFVYAGDTPRMADMYSLGIHKIPVDVRRGSNTVLARVERGRPRLSWSAPRAALAFDASDATLPDIVATGPSAPSQPERYLGAIVIVNATRETFDNVSIAARIDDGAWRSSPLEQPLLPLETRKVAFEFEARAPAAFTARLALELRDLESEHLDALELELGVRATDATHRRTFRSAVDGSVQTYSIVPSTAAPGDPAPGIVLSLHGASVEAASQAACYAPRSWAHVVAPTNRRPYGFDWEDWGRLDALEVLAHVEARERVDPARRYLTGHSMGGHGAWNLGVLRSDLFAAVAPSAGWIDFWSYGQPEPEPASDVERLLRRASNASRTLLMVENLASRGVYVLHGDADDNVPVTQARRMREELAKFHPDFAYYERPDAGHWWGNECVDWPPLMAFLEARVRPERPEIAAFTTVDLDVRDREAWLIIEGVARRMEPATAAAVVDVAQGKVRVTTANVTHLAFELRGEGESAERVAARDVRIPGLESRASFSVELDGHAFEAQPTAASVLRFERAIDGIWRASKPGAGAPPRPGPSFKAAFATVSSWSTARPARPRRTSERGARRASTPSSSATAAMLRRAC